MSCNEKLGNLSIKVSDGNTISGTYDSLVVIEKMMVQLKIMVPADENDKSFQKQFFKTSIDVQKLFNGVQGSFVLKVIMENFFKSIDFEPKFPLPKVF